MLGFRAGREKPEIVTEGAGDRRLRSVSSRGGPSTPWRFLAVSVKCIGSPGLEFRQVSGEGRGDKEVESGPRGGGPGTEQARIRQS